MYDPFDALTWGKVALMVWYVPSSPWRAGVSNQKYRIQKDRRTVSISITVLNPFSERPEIGARKFPAAPGVQWSLQGMDEGVHL